MFQWRTYKVTFKTCKVGRSCLVQEKLQKTYSCEFKRPVTSFIWRVSEMASWGSWQLTSSSKFWTNGWRERQSGQEGHGSRMTELGVVRNTSEEQEITDMREPRG